MIEFARSPPFLSRPGWQAKMNEDGFVLLTRLQDRDETAMKDDVQQGRSRHLRDRQEQPLQDRRGDAGRPREDRVLSAVEVGRRLFLRRVRCARRDGGARARSAHPPRLDARCGSRRGRRVRSGCARRRCLSPQRSLFRRQPPARRECRAAGLPRGSAARLRLPARALAGCRLRHARQLRRSHGYLRRGAAHAAAAAHQPRCAQCGS